MAKQTETKAHNVDIALVGGGPAGLVASLLLARSGVGVVCFAPKPRHEDLRTSALMQGSVEILKSIDVWDELEPRSAPLRVMRLIDNTGRLLRAPSVEFNADEIGTEPYGHNFKNRDLVAALRKKANNADNLMLVECAINAIDIGADHATLTDSTGQTWTVDLIVAADGRMSGCRKAAGIEVSEKTLPQTALAFNVTHTRPHDFVSTEFHRPHGPLTFVPLPGNCSSVVWVESPATIKRLLAMKQEKFLEEFQEQSYGILGDITEIGPIGSFPLTHLDANMMAQNRTVLVGEAGHVLPPIGAQGLNLGFRDALTISELVAKAKSNGLTASDSSVLEAYDKQRRSDISSRSKFVKLLNQSVLSDFLPVQAARGVGLFALANINPLRHLAMKTGIGPIPKAKSKVG